MLEHKEHGDIENGFDDLTDHFNSMIGNPLATAERSEEQNYNMIIRHKKIKMWKGEIIVNTVDKVGYIPL